MEATQSRTLPRPSSIVALGPQWDRLLVMFLAPLLRGLGPIDAYSPDVGLPRVIELCMSVLLLEGPDAPAALIDEAFLLALRLTGQRVQAALADTTISGLIPVIAEGDETDHLLRAAEALAEAARQARRRSQLLSRGLSASASTPAASAAPAAAAQSPSTPKGPPPFSSTTSHYHIGTMAFKRPEFEAGVKALNPALTKPGGTGSSGYNVQYLLLGVNDDAHRAKLVGSNSPGPHVLPRADWSTAELAEVYVNTAASTKIIRYFQ
jgi:hypothetical protein